MFYNGVVFGELEGRGLGFNDLLISRVILSKLRFFFVFIFFRGKGVYIRVIRKVC